MQIKSENKTNKLLACQENLLLAFLSRALCLVRPYDVQLICTQTGRFSLLQTCTIIMLSIGSREKWLDPMSCCTLPIFVQDLAGFQSMCYGVKAGKPKDSALP